jgi:hypothetical protein
MAYLMGKLKNLILKIRYSDNNVAMEIRWRAGSELCSVEAIPKKTNIEFEICWLVCLPLELLLLKRTFQNPHLIESPI